MRATLCIVLCLAAASVQRSSPSDSHYVAAVLEYSQHSSTEQNLVEYEQFIQQAAQQNADIVVFPEMTLTRGDVVSIPIHGLLREFPTPALHPELYDEVLVRLSRAARRHALYVVVNVQEALDCSSTPPPPPGELCPAAELYRFNTNVVFDRDGSVIDRYRKINLFGEATRTPALDGQLGVFSTDFGVTFGHFICFDLMFQVPAIQVVQKHNITDVVFTTMWFSEMPFLTAVEIQEAYAFANNVNLLASGASRVAVGSAGSGIYSGQAGALVSTMPGVDTRKLLVSRVPKVPGAVQNMVYPGHLPNDPKEMDALWLKRDQSLPAHVSRVLLETEEPQSFVLRDGSVTCRFHVQLADLRAAGDQVYEYRATAFDGVRTFDGVASGGSRVCSLVACSGPHVDTCSVRFPEYSANSTRRFSELVIVATVPAPTEDPALATADAAYFPTSLHANILPLSVKEYEYTQGRGSDGRYHISLRLLAPQSELLAFGVWGRVFAGDGLTPTEPK